ncbi:Ribonuclease_T2 domain-containing protein [Cephalotus follicularis]|uniref:Ribonuclease_T2 domain-containing protein n=1 Tax=Cephalotus follicularis TaxID=3775 RepID=M5B0H1_CEPFO|nr:S-like ribonuclease [Cephalotus follicularis]GAV76166.1 Ribonuclease_T2 domain-containing protein [Cephalotus follicularis]
MKSKGSLLIKLLIIQYLSSLFVAQNFDFFYFVQQWPGSYCDTSQGCCYPPTGKPASDFGIHGLWPNNNDGSYPSNCDPNNPFNQSEVSDLMSSLETNWPSLACPSSDGISFWTHEWDKHGTCSESVLDEHDYFQAALNLKSKTNLLQALASAGINPNGESYNLSDIINAINQSDGFTPSIECNDDESGNNQLYQVYMCVDTSGSNLIECSVSPTGANCANQITFPAF